jgi:hypothetical protein
VNHISQRSDAFTGGVDIPITSQLQIVSPNNFDTWPVYRVMGTDGALLEGAVEPELDTVKVNKILGCIIKLRAMDKIFLVHNAKEEFLST